MTKKTLGKKLRLSRALRRAKSVPLWIILKTNRKVRSSKRARNWRRSPRIFA